MGDDVLGRRTSPRGASEGEAFAVPLASGGYATAVIGRVATGRAQGVALGYFFGPRFPVVPGVESLAGLRPQLAVLIRKFGDLGIVEGTWPHVGRMPNWQRHEWPIPAFKRRSPLDRQLWRVEHPSDDPNSTPRETVITEEEAAGLPEDGLSGDVAIARILDGLIPGAPPREADA